MTKEEQKQRFLDVMSLTWDVLVEAEAERPETFSRLKEADVVITLRYDGTDDVIATRPVVMMMDDDNDFKLLDPEG